MEKTQEELKELKDNEIEEISAGTRPKTPMDDPAFLYKRFISAIANKNKNGAKTCFELLKTHYSPVELEPLRVMYRDTFGEDL